MRDSMIHCHDLINESWQQAKIYFELDPQTVEEYDKFTESLGKWMQDTMTKYGSTSKEYQLARRLYVAIDEYCGKDNNERRHGEQMSLWNS